MEQLDWAKLKKRTVDGIAGLVLVIAQDHSTGEVLMAAFTDREAFEKTVKTKKAHYYSTSRKKMWLKGESSGHIQDVKEILVDCDCDAILLKVDQKGGACHTGYRSCFYRRLSDSGLEVAGEKVFDPREVY